MRLQHHLFASAAVFAANKGEAPATGDDTASGVDVNSAEDQGVVQHVQETEETTVSAEGIRSRRAIMLKQFIPEGSVDWIMKNIVAQGKGTRATLGRVFGICTGYELKNGTLPDGTPSQSVVLVGDFQTEDYTSGELGQGVNFYAPAAYAEKVRAIYDANRVTDEAGRTIGSHIRSVEVDVDIGLEATGKTIPYEWVIIAFREGSEMAVLKKMRSARPRPMFVMQSAGKTIEALPRPNVGPIPMLEAPVEAAAES